MSCKARGAQRRRLRAMLTEAIVDWVHAYGEVATDCAVAEVQVMLA